MRPLKHCSLLILIISLLIPTLGQAYPGKVIKKFKTPGHIPTGLTHDGQNLWMADRKAKMLFAVNPETGELQKKISSPAYWPMGLTFDGEHLWSVDVKGGIPLSENYNGVVYKVDPTDGTVLHTVSAPTGTPRGLAWDGKYLWCVDNSQDKVIQFNPNDGTTIKSFDAPARDPRGIAYDGQYLWITDRTSDEIYMVSPENGSVIIIAEAPGPFTRGITSMGGHLWAVDSQNDELCQIKAKSDEPYRRTNPVETSVTYTHQVTNFGPGNVKTLDIHLAIPHDRPNQEVEGEISYSPEYTDVVTDQWDQETAHLSRENMKPNERVNFEMKVNCTLYDVRYNIYPDQVGNLSEVPQDIKDKYLANNEKYQYNHPVIQDAVKKSLGKDETNNPYWMARKMFNYIIDNMYYEMVGGWNTAPAVLERGNGSCSEYTFVYIAMCRSVGIPARYVGSLVVRGDKASMDDVFHRWVEIYLPNYGWVPVDPSGGDRKLPRDQANAIGHLPARYLITTQSGGGSKTMEWTYNSNDSWTTEPKTYVVSDNFADWAPQTP
jgi:transglutaminase-like putative cysteine protease